MIIRKQFDVEMAHVVRNCSSSRCRLSQHGHSATIELFFESQFLSNNDHMLMDFGLMKQSIKQFIDGMDHCYVFSQQDTEEFKNFHRKYDERYIGLPFNPSAEMLTVFIFNVVQRIMDCSELNNGECNVHLKAVRYHETKSGYAECDVNDATSLWRKDYASRLEFSDGVTKDWDTELIKCVNEFIDGKPARRLFVYPTIKQQVNFKD